MSQMFKNYIKGNIHIPDNQTEFLHQAPEYKDVMILGANNDHTFQLSPSKSEIRQLEVFYKQGTEIKLTKTFIMDFFYRPLYENEEESDVGEWLYPNGEAKLYCFSNKELEDQYEHSVEHGRYDVYKSILFYNISPEESRLFNDYNNDFTVQAKVIYEDGCIEFTDIYKIKVVKTIPTREEN